MALILIGLPLMLENRGRIVFFALNAGSLLDDYASRTDIPYGDRPRQKLDVYRPPGGRSRPIVVFWYGGAWVTGSRSQYGFVGSALADAGYVAVLPDYRLYPEARFPKFIEDGALAVRWVQQHGAEFGGDPRNIFLMGHSAGAHIAASLALDHRHLARLGGEPTSIRGLIGISGPYGVDHQMQFYYAKVFTAPYTDADWLPIHLAGSAAPPALLMHGTDDWMVGSTQTTEFAQRLAMLKVPVAVRFYPERTHQDTVSAFSRVWRFRAPVLEEVRAFIDQRGAAR